MYNLIILLGIYSAFCVQLSESFLLKENNKIVGCYFDRVELRYGEPNGKFEIPNIDGLCTHVVYSYNGILDQSRINAQNNIFKNFKEFRKQNPSVKILLSLPGWTQLSKNKYAPSNSILRRDIAKNIVDLVAKNGFDGFDLQWEYPVQLDGYTIEKKYFVLLLQEIRQQFDKQGLILCVSVGATEETAKTSYDINGISKNAHIINLRTYDFHNPYESKSKLVGHNSPLYPSKNESAQDKTLNVANAVKYWIAGGASPKKILVGTAMFGFPYTLSNPQKIGRGAPFTGPGNAVKFTSEYGTWGYNQICELIKNEKWQVLFDTEQEVPYAYKGNQLVAFDDVESLARKAHFINEMNLGGTMAMSIDNDDFNGVCGEKYPLLRVLNRILRDN